MEVATIITQDYIAVSVAKLLHALAHTSSACVAVMVARDIATTLCRTQSANAVARLLFDAIIAFAVIAARDALTTRR